MGQRVGLRRELPVELESTPMIYLDNNATTPLDSRVRDRLLEVLDGAPANAASQQYSEGRKAHAIVDSARRQAAQALDVAPSQLVWTAGATEAIVMGVFGVVAAAPKHSRIMLVSPTEHKAVIAAAEMCVRTLGAGLIYLDVTSDGTVNPDSVRSNMSDAVCLVATMHSNNETGAINPIDEIAKARLGGQAQLLVDCTQSVGKVDTLDVMKCADATAISAHKVYGPKGVGALILNRELKKHLLALMPGGGQESGLRGGTHNTAGIAAAALAIELAIAELEQDSTRARQQMNTLWEALKLKLRDISLVSGAAERLPNTTNVRFIGADAEAVMANAPKLAVSTGSACNSASPEPSHVLLAMGMNREEAEECIRFSTGRLTTDEEIREAAILVSESVRRVRQLTAA